MRGVGWDKFIKFININFVNGSKGLLWFVYLMLFVVVNLGEIIFLYWVFKFVDV